MVVNRAFMAGSWSCEMDANVARELCHGTFGAKPCTVQNVTLSMAQTMWCLQ